jgi:predicted esterase
MEAMKILARIVLPLLGAWGGLSDPSVATAQECDGCLVLLPRDPRPAPLLVVLHGDEGGPSKVFATWKPIAEEKGAALFAPRCPVAQGCHVGSFWRWAGDPQWLFDRMAELEKRHAIDPDRRYLAGWSGGASYIGLFADRWGERFAAIALTGGGIPPRSGPACDACAPAVRYSMGDRNPLFYLAEQTREHFERCKHALDWRPLPGKDHAAEWRAFAEPNNLAATFDWLLARRRACDTSGHVGDAGDRAPSDAAPDGASLRGPQLPPASLAPSSTRRAGTVAPARQGCSCDLPGAPLVPLRQGAFGAALMLVFCALARSTRRILGSRR